MRSSWQAAKLGFRRTSNPGLSTPACPVFQSYAVTATPETEAMVSQNQWVRGCCVGRLLHGPRWVCIPRAAWAFGRLGNVQAVMDGRISSIVIDRDWDWDWAIHMSDVSNCSSLGHFLSLLFLPLPSSYRLAYACYKRHTATPIYTANHFPEKPLDPEGLLAGVE